MIWLFWKKIPQSTQFPSGAKAENTKIYITAYLEEEEKEEGRRSAVQLLHRRRRRRRRRRGGGGDRPEKKKKKRLTNASSRRLICPPHLHPVSRSASSIFFFSPSTSKPNIDFDMIFLSPHSIMFVNLWLWLWICGSLCIICFCSEKWVVVFE